MIKIIANKYTSSLLIYYMIRKYFFLASRSTHFFLQNTHRILFWIGTKLDKDQEQN